MMTSNAGRSRLEDLIDDVQMPLPTRGGVDRSRRGQRGVDVVTSWSEFNEMLPWLEIGDVAQARRAFLRALNRQ